MKRWQIAVVVGIVLVTGALTAAAVAVGIDRGGSNNRGSVMMGPDNGYGQSQDAWQGQSGQSQSMMGSGGGMMGSGGSMMGPGSGIQGSGGSQLSTSERQQLLDLMQEHRADMQSWWQKYGDDPQSPAAQKALAQVRSEHVQEMQRLFDELGVQGMGPWHVGQRRP